MRTRVKEPLFYTAYELVPLLGFKNANAVYAARRNGHIPPGQKIGRRLKFPKFQIDAMLAGKDWRTAAYPLDASAPLQAETAGGDACSDSSVGAGGCFLDLIFEKLADELFKRLEKKYDRRERHEAQVDVDMEGR